ncbi:hypothetical protein F4810DRAFT_47594 [Camillea tinctor]|nr:hypothetical protein F4810DRAFT_47594 [Camillea tinctor]
MIMVRVVVGLVWNLAGVWREHILVFFDYHIGWLGLAWLGWRANKFFFSSFYLLVIGLYPSLLFLHLPIYGKMNLKSRREEKQGKERWWRDPDPIIYIPPLGDLFLEMVMGVFTYCCCCVTEDTIRETAMSSPFSVPRPNPALHPERNPIISKLNSRLCCVFIVVWLATGEVAQPGGRKRDKRNYFICSRPCTFLYTTISPTSTPQPLPSRRYEPRD